MWCKKIAETYPEDKKSLRNSTRGIDITFGNIAAAYGNVQIVKNGKNMGFAYAVNQGILESTGEYVLTLNPDVIVTEGYVDTLFEK